MMRDKTIVRNKAQCLICNDIIESRHRHDFVTCKCGNVSVDGGYSYIRGAFIDASKIEELSEFKDDING